MSATHPAFRRKTLALCCATAFSLPAMAASDIVISQIYGGGGNSGATLRNDFIELFNRSAAPVSLAGWSVQYASASGSSWQVTPLSGTLQPGQYYLVQQAQGAGGSQNLPTPDATGSIPMSGSAGKVALLSSSTQLSGTCPSGGSLVEIVGFGGANCSETAPTATLNNTTAALRKNNGCTDTDNNGSDFATGAPAPRNSASLVNACGGAPANQPIVPSCPAVSLASGVGGSAVVSASDADSIVNGLVFAAPAPGGFSISGFNAASADGGTANGSINVAPSVGAGSYVLNLLWSNNEAQSIQCTLNVNVSGITSIPAIQGSGTSSRMVGQNVTTRGVVTKLTNNGFFMQDPVGDGNPLTSDGIYVFSSSAPSVAVGQLIQLSGTVAEYNTGAASNADTAARPVTQLVSPSGISVLSSGNVITPVVVNLPEAVNDDLERYEGMLVTLTGPLTAAQNFFQGRYGQVTLAVGGRLETPTNRHRPGPDAQNLADENARRRIILDDGTSIQNPNPTPYFAADNTLRAGDTVDSITGVIDYGLATNNNANFGDYKIHPTEPVSFARVNERTAAPNSVGGNYKVASFNVLNFFTTFTDGNTASGQSGQGCTLGASNAASNCRGASNIAEFNRQRAKIVNALKSINADVVGLMEIQNNGNVATQNLVDALNAAVGAGTYAAVPVPAAGTGTDAIRVAMIYKPTRLSLAGATASDVDAINNRPTLVQGFAAANGEKFMVAVNHLKSKGSCPSGGADDDQGDGQGCWNAQRVQQAQQLRSFLAAQQAASGISGALIIGDLNAYAKEDPIVELTDNGYVDLVGQHADFGYTYVFDGAAGRLDHALASTAMASRVAGTTVWHINADEPSVIDYNLEFKQPACAACGPDYYSTLPYRSSDHDPVVVGLSLVKPVIGSKGRDTLAGTAGDDLIEGGEGADTITTGNGNDVLLYRSLRDAADTVTDFAPGSDRIDLSVLLTALGVSGDAFASGHVRVIDSAAGAIVQIDADGMAGTQAFRPLLTLRGVTAAQIVPARDFILGN